VHIVALITILRQPTGETAKAGKPSASGSADGLGASGRGSRTGSLRPSRSKRINRRGRRCATDHQLPVARASTLTAGHLLLRLVAGCSRRIDLGKMLPTLAHTCPRRLAPSGRGILEWAANGSFLTSRDERA